jgi:hypothetical protein
MFKGLSISSLKGVASGAATMLWKIFNQEASFA